MQDWLAKLGIRVAAGGLGTDDGKRYRNERKVTPSASDTGLETETGPEVGCKQGSSLCNRE